jgi:hypothetical protein
MLYGFLQYPSKGSHLDLPTADLMKPYCYYCMAMRRVQWTGSKTERDACMPAPPPPHTHAHTHTHTTPTAWWDDKHNVFVYRRKTDKKLRPALFWDIMQWVMVIPYWCFGTTYGSHLQGSRNQNGYKLDFKKHGGLSGEWKHAATDKAH